MPRHDDTRPRAGGAATPSGFRPDVEGLRAIAILVVVLSHAGVRFAAGGYVGVDVFFVVSGFVITRLLLSELERSGGLSLTRFYARRAKRLLPLAALVLGVTVALSAWQGLPAGPDSIARDVSAAALYVANWRFASSSASYFAGPDQVSPVQHFWSLAIEEQFYLVWPLLLLGLTAWWRRSSRRAPRAVVGAALGTIVVASLTYAAIITRDAAGAAYFSTLARVWELAIGASLAAFPLLSRLPRTLARPLAWAGLGAIGAATLTFDSATHVPGPAGLLPTLGAAALIMAGARSARPLPVRLLSSRPMQAVGRHSYALYLWHWPLLVFAGARWGPLSPVDGLLVVAFSVIPTVVSHHWIEEPLRRSKLHVRRPRRTLAWAPACAGLVVGLALMLPLLEPSVPTLAAAKVHGADVMGAHASLQRRADGLRPSPRRAGKDRSDAYSDGCLVQERDTRSRRCVYGRRSSSREVALFGDSHAMHWFPAVRAVARHGHWRLTELTKAGCPASAVRVYNRVLRRAYHECNAWREHTLRRIERERPGLVVVSSANFYRVYDGSHRLGADASVRRLEQGWVRTLRRLRRTGARVVVIGDPPHPPRDIPSCVARALHHLRKCAFSRSAGLAFPHVATRAAHAVGGTRLIDATPLFCLRRICPAVIGDVIVYRNAGHLTATYAQSAWRWLGRRLPRPRRR